MHPLSNRAYKIKSLLIRFFKVRVKVTLPKIKIYKMKKQLIYYSISVLGLFTSCGFNSGVKPKIGDAVFYDYVIKQGDSVVHKASNLVEDTAFMILETTNEPLQQKLIEKILSLSINDSTTFDLDNNRKGFLRLHRIISPAEFPKYIEEAQKKDQIFEQRLKEIGNELKTLAPFYQNRRKTVLDSTVLFNDMFKKGLLKDKLKPLSNGVFYDVVKGSDKLKRDRKKWVWFHFATVMPDNKITDSYNKMPKLTNLSEFEFNEYIERSAAKFDEGSIVLLAIPTKPMNTGEKIVASETKDSILIWIEIVKVVER